MPHPRGFIRVVLLGREDQFVELVLNAETIDRLQPLSGTRPVRAGNPPHRPVQQTAHARVNELHEPIESAGTDLGTGQPVRPLGTGTARDIEPIAGDLRPHVRLGPVHPGPAELQVTTKPVLGPRAAAEPIAGLEHGHAQAHPSELAGGD